MAIPSLPELPMHFVRRERLELRISQGLTRRVTLVTGTAGAGKSVLVAGWARQRAQDTTAYLSLEADDNSPPRFWRRLVAALRVVDPEVGDNVLAALAVGMDDLQLTEVLTAETAVMRPAVIVIDGLEVLRASTLTNAVQYLASNLPSHVHLIITTRDSSLPTFHRLRLHGDLSEIGDADLRFRDDEASLLVSSMAGARTLCNGIATLLARTEGWAAGLVLAALSATGSGDGAASLATDGDDTRLIDEYFQREVLQDQPADTVQFLIETSVLKTMTAESCQYVTGRADAFGVLDTLAECHLFIVPVDDNERSYRYQRLFADYLRLRAARRQPELVKQAHVRAAAWSQANGRHRIAFDHLVKAEAHQEALALGAATAVRQLDCTQPEPEGLLPGHLPATYLESDPWRMYVIGAALLADRRPREAARWLHRLSTGLGDSAHTPALASRVEMLWALHDALLEDAPGVLRHQNRVNEHLDHHPGQQSPLLPPADRDWLGPLDSAVADRFRVAGAWARLRSGHPKQALATLDALVSIRPLQHDVACLSLRAAAVYSEGRLREAHMLAQQALDEAHRQPWVETMSLLSARLTIAAVLRERDELQRAEACLTEALTTRPDDRTRAETTEVVCELIRLMTAQGRHWEALEHVARLRRLDREEPLPVRLGNKLDRAEIGCRLAIRDIHGARLIIRSLSPLSWYPETLGRLELLAGRPDHAERVLRPALDGLPPHRAKIERLVLLARAQFQTGRHDRAEGTLRRALDLGRPERYVRPFLNDEPAVLSLLETIAGRHPDDYLGELVEKARPGAPCGGAPAVSRVIENLSLRERDVLTLLPSHLTQREIAAAMYVSLNTVKSHTKAVYRKLGAASRSAAVQTARYHGLV